MEKMKDKKLNHLKSLLITDLINENTPAHMIHKLSIELLAITSSKRKRRRNARQ